MRDSVRLLMKVARFFSEKRRGLGALDLEGAEIRVKFDENHKTVADLVAKVQLPIPTANHENLTPQNKHFRRAWRCMPQLPSA